MFFLLLSLHAVIGAGVTFASDGVAAMMMLSAEIMAFHPYFVMGRKASDVCIAKKLTHPPSTFNR